MNKMRLMGPLASFVMLLQLPGCQAIAPASSHGSLSFRFNAPALATPIAFNIKAIPTGTRRFEIEISGKGLDTPHKEIVDYTTGQSTQTKTITDLPVGEKKVTVKAVQDNVELARATTTVTIEAGKTAQAPIELTASKSEVKAQLGTALPINLQVKAKITGEGLTSPQEKTLTFPANQIESSLGILPLGAKKINLTLMVTVNGKQISAPEAELSLNVTAKDSLLKISAENVLSGFGSDLEAILSQTDLVSLLAWIGFLKQNPDRVRELFFKLPPEAQARLRANPLVSGSGFLPPPEANPSPTPEPSPSASASAEPGVITVPGTVPSAPAAAFNLLADTRLALAKLANPDAIMEEPPVDVGGLIRLPKANDSINVGKNLMWGLMLRSNYTGSKPVLYSVAILKQGDTNPLFSQKGNLSKRFNVNGQSYNGDILPFRNGELVPVTTGLYDMKIEIHNPDTPNIDATTFQLKIN